MIVIVDHKVGNIFSITSACKFLGVEYVVSSSAKKIGMTSKLIITGVGNFSEGMKNLKKLTETYFKKKFTSNFLKKIFLEFSATLKKVNMMV